MPDRIVIADASTLIGLHNLNSLELLHELYGHVEVTTIVGEETAIDLPDWIRVDDNYNRDVYRSLLPSLDAGEASSIALALAHESALLIIDERKGRRRAKSLGIVITGLIGILIRAKQRGLISSGKDKLDNLREQGFRLSEKIYELALREM
ncbi:putative nucleic acid-binding protein, partial [Lewinella aquimaris]